jgi:hypothetical protein
MAPESVQDRQGILQIQNCFGCRRKASPQLYRAMYRRCYTIDCNMLNSPPPPKWKMRPRDYIWGPPCLGTTYGPPGGPPAWWTVIMVSHSGAMNPRTQSPRTIRTPELRACLAHLIHFRHAAILKADVIYDPVKWPISLSQMLAYTCLLS